MKFEKIETSGGSSAKGGFINLKDGDSVTGVLVASNADETPTMYYKHWVGGKYHICTGADCIHCQDGDRPSRKFALNIITAEDDGLKANIFEFSTTVNNQLVAFNEECPVDETVVKISRSGAGTDTTYTIMEAKKNVPAALQNVAGVKAEVEVTDLDAMVTAMRDKATKGFNTDSGEPF